MLTPDEQIDFTAVIRAEGLSVDDFEVTAAEDPRPPIGIHPVRTTVTVLRRSTGILLTYRGGYKSTWPILLKNDLVRRAFG